MSWREIDQEEAMVREWRRGEERVLVGRSLSNEEARRAVGRGNRRARRRRRREQLVALVMMPWALGRALARVVREGLGGRR